MRVSTNKKIKHLLKWVFSRMLCVFPIQKNKIIFDNFGGRAYGDDPKYICNELLKSNKYRIIWLTTNDREDFPEGVKAVKYRSIAAFYHWSTAKVWVDNIKNSSKPIKRKNQFYIQTWHAAIGLKMIEKDAVEVLPVDYVYASILDSKMIDLMYTNNQYMYEIYRNSFWYGGRIIRCGIPRMSPLFHESRKLKEEVYQRLGIPRDEKMVLYAPTYRLQESKDLFTYNYEKICLALGKRFGGEYRFVNRMHPNDAEKLGEAQNQEHIINATDYPDMQELLAAADVLITDYSSCMFDFAFSGKKVFLFTKDLEYYTQNERGVYFQLSQLPFPMSTTEEELEYNIEHFSEQAYQNQCRTFFDLIGLQEDGNGAKILAEVIRNQC